MDPSEVLTLVVENILRLFPVRIVHSYQQGVKFRFGKDIKLKTTGIHLYFPFFESLEVRSTVPEVVNLPNQSLITRDYKPICVSGAVEYQITDLRRWWIGVQDFDNTLINTALGFLSREVRQLDFDNIRQDCGGLESKIFNSLSQKVEDWGTELLDFYITDLVPVRPFMIYGNSGGDLFRS